MATNSDFTEPKTQFGCDRTRSCSQNCRSPFRTGLVAGLIFIAS